MFLDDVRPWRCKTVVNTSVFSFRSTKIAQNTVFLDVFDLKYLTRNHNNNNNNNNNNNHDNNNNNNNNNNNKNKNKNKKNIWHLVSLVRADPAAERREYHYSSHRKFLTLLSPLEHPGFPRCDSNPKPVLWVSTQPTWMRIASKLTHQSWTMKSYQNSIKRRLRFFC